jgi:ADP-ribose pyrophosphatase YjhB (NUDIX family)
MHPDHFSNQAATLGFDRYFERTYVGVLDKRARIHELLTQNHLDPRETLSIGDMQHDVETARHGGVLSCAVLTGYTELQALRASQPDLIVEHLGELGQILEDNGWNLPARTVAAVQASRQRPVVTVGGLIFNRSDELLMIRTHKWSNLWGIPGGKVRWGESAVDALVREIKEETNLDVTDVRFVLVQDCIHSKEFYRDAHFVLLNYTCRSTGSSLVKLNEEAQEFRWVSLAEAGRLPLNSPTRLLLATVQEGNSPPADPLEQACP